MNRLNIEERARILGFLVEGNSIRATCRMTGADCKAYHDKNVWMIAIFPPDLAHDFGGHLPNHGELSMA